MQHLNRLGVIVAATALAGTSALAGAGVSSAQSPGEPADVTFDSASSVSVDRVGEDVVVSYSNQSGRDLKCGVIVSNSKVVNGLYQHYRTADLIIGEPEPEFPAALQNDLLAAKIAGEYGEGTISVVQGASGPVTYLDETEVLQPTSTTLVPEAFVMCQGDVVDELATYTEFEISTAGGGPGGGDGPAGGDVDGGLFGSLVNLIPALGS